MSDHYEELGVEPTASKDQIREAHRERLSELEAARSGKNVTEAQLQANRDEAARVRSAWNVLSDPMQRQRYDQQLMDERAGDGVTSSEVELVDDDAAPAGPAPTGWRKLLAPPPAKPAAGGGGGGAKGAANRQPLPPSGNPNRPAPTVVLPDGMQLAPTRQRGMALLFDLAVCMVISTVAWLALPGLIQSDYASINTQITKVKDVNSAAGDLQDAQSSLKDAQSSLNKAKSASDTKSAQSDVKSAQSDVKSAQKDLQKAEKDAKKEGLTAQQIGEGESAKQQVKTTDDLTTELNKDIQTTQYVMMGIVIAVALLYLVPITARTGSSFGMRNRRVKVVMVDGSKVRWYPAFVRFALPVILAVALSLTLGPVGPMIGLGMVLWAFRDRNGQGVHDKLARTLVVNA